VEVGKKDYIGSY